MKDLQIELSKTQAIINATIEAVRHSEEHPNNPIDILGCLLVIQDKVNDIEKLVE